jgi:hypothetical protein
VGSFGAYVSILFGGKQIWISTGTTLKSEAESIERQILVACGSQDYRSLDPMARKACLKTFRKQGRKIPADLSGEEPITEELPLRKSMELTLRYPEIRNSPTRERVEQCFEHLTDYFGVSFQQIRFGFLRSKSIKLYAHAKVRPPER